jgi:hypothetical protein
MRTVALLLALLSCPGCATLVRSRYQDVRWESVPPGASLTLEGRRQANASESSIYYATCTMPCTISMGRSGQPATYRVQLDGYQWFDGQLVPADDVSAAQVLPMVFDLLLVVPYLVDRSVGTFYEWPEKVTITLPPAGSGQPPTVVVER